LPSTATRQNICQAGRRTPSHQRNRLAVQVACLLPHVLLGFGGGTVGYWCSCTSAHCRRGRRRPVAVAEQLGNLAVRDAAEPAAKRVRAPRGTAAGTGPPCGRRPGPRPRCRPPPALAAGTSGSPTARTASGSCARPPGREAAAGPAATPRWGRPDDAKRCARHARHGWVNA
jgi:hypothetical protein